MPRDGSGRSHNAYDLAPESDHNIVHGAGNEPQGDHVARADKTAPMPEHGPGLGLKDLPASGGTSQGLADPNHPDRGQGGRGEK
ncbi:hypothetical protein F5Y18DRAFT_433181 [Xylariaceae sp. FL1019]|nr:hypothetical protein F5Y18DRAFT_433181 [Xylariaceae sp. FL1019]